MDKLNKELLKVQGFYHLDHYIKCRFCGINTKFSDAICLNCDDIVPDHIPNKQHDKYILMRRRKYGKYKKKTI